MKLLHVESSILGAHSASRSIATAVVDKLVQDNPGIEIVTRDLVADPLPHMTIANMPGAHPATAHSPEALGDDRAMSDAVLSEFLAADIVVVGAPMYNFSMSSQLKSWIDRIVIPGTTFRKGDAGPEGLCGDKRVIVAASRGGVYGQGSPFAPAEHLETLLRTTFGFIGIRNLEVIVAEGISQGPEVRQAAIDGALQSVAGMAA